MKKIFLSILSLIMIIPVSGASALEQTDESFKDVSFYHDYSLAIDYLKENEIVKGYGDGSFKPDNTISRAEFAKIIVGSVAKIEDINEYDGKQCFPDVSISDPLNKYVCYAKDNEIIRGFDDGTYGPTLPISFHEASKILLESFGIEIGDMNSPDWYKTVLAKMSELNDIPESVKEFDKKITRGEMSELVLRVEEKDSNYISQKYEKDTNKFQSNISNIESCEVLKSKLDEFAQNDRGYPMLLNDVMAPMMKSADLQSMSESSVAGDYSQTNVQVAGVDEGDTIKNDGKYIYMVKDDSVRIVEAYPAENMKEIYNLDFSNDDFNPTELYLSDEKLVVLGNIYEDYSYQEPALYEISIMRMPAYYSTPRVGVKTYDVSNHSLPKLERTVTFKGDMRSSRVIDGYLYGAVTSYPDYRVYNEDGYDIDDIVPVMSDSSNGGEDQVVANCGQIKIMPPISDPSFMTIFSLSIDDPNKEVDKEVVVGRVENLYSSKDNFYTISTLYDNNFYPSGVLKRSRPSIERTLINKFNLDEGNIEYEGSGKVPGRVLNQFSMDEYENNFRIATTTGYMWATNIDDISKNNLYVLDEDLKIVGDIEGMAQGEKIYSTRFMGDRGYIVTFKNVDPLFVIDLSDPKDPEVLGKLKIPGYSDYLHPYDETHIIGFGKDAVEVTGEEKENRDNFAWYQGMKIALFDVSDVNNPKQMFSEVIGDRGTQSELLNNHKALLFNRSKNLLAFPISVAEVPEGSDPSAYGETVFSGAYIYDLDLVNGFTFRTKKSHYDLNSINYKIAGDYYYGDYDREISRIIYIGDNLFTVSNGYIGGYELDTYEDIGILKL